MSAIDVRVESISKEYRLGTRRSADRFLALSDVSFDVPRGASLGIIGPNGAGKSTLLKLLSGITAPTRGRITITGVLSALIEVGSGFHPELTGRENVFLSGAILGMRRREIAQRLDAIVAFAGVERFVDTPVKWYSSGMYVRLGFAVAAHLQPDILLVDEVLAVGDAEFQARCLQRINELRAGGVTIIFISHDLSAVQQLCDTALLLDRGRIAAIGNPSDVVAAYHRRVVNAQKAGADTTKVVEDSSVVIANLTLHDADGTAAAGFTAGAAAIVRVHWNGAEPRPVSVEVVLSAADGRTRIATLSTQAGTPLHGSGLVEFEIPALTIPAGSYYVSAILRDTGSGAPLDWWDGGTTLHVVAQARSGGSELYLPHRARVVYAASRGT